MDGDALGSLLMSCCYSPRLLPVPTLVTMAEPQWQWQWQCGNANDDGNNNDKANAIARRRRSTSNIMRLCALSMAVMAILAVTPLPSSVLSARHPPAPIPRLPMSEWESKFRVGATTPLIVHLVPHSHDDVGYEKTWTQYYIGSNNTIRVGLTM